MNYTLSFIALVFIGSLPASSQPLTDIRIVKEDQQSVILEYTPHIKAEQVVGSGGSIFTRFCFFESQTIFDSTGQADFTRNIPLLFPSQQYSLQVLESQFEVRDSIRLLPKPIIKSLKDFGVQTIYDETKFKQQARSPLPMSLSEVVRAGKTSMGYTGTLVFRPIQVVDKQKVRVYSRILVRLDFKDAFSNGLRSTCFLRGELPTKAQLVQPMSSGIRKITSGNSPLSQGDWYRIDLTDVNGATSEGMYKIDYTYLRSMNISVTDINSIRIFGNGGLTIPENNTDPRPDSLIEIPRLVVRKNTNGTDTSDYVVFYGRGVRGWNYDASAKSFSHYINPYTEKNSYFITVTQGTGRQMDLLASPTSAANTSQFFQEKILVEQERENVLASAASSGGGSGRRWVGKDFTGTDNTDTYYNSLPGIVPNSQINYVFKFVRRSASADMLNIYESGNLLQSLTMWGTEMGDGETSPFAEDVSIGATGGVPQATPPSSVVKIQVTTDNQDSKTWLDWMDIYYQRKYEAANDALLFTTADAAGSIQYTITNYSSDIRAYDVTDHSSVKQISINQTGTSCTLQLLQTAGRVYRIAVIGKNGYKTPPAGIKVPTYAPVNLHEYQDQADFIIISPNEFITEANRLRDHRLLHDSLRTVVVDIQQIFNEFGGGLPDPLSVREFLQYTQDHWTSPRPRYVLLLGNGHYDYKNISTTQRNYIPPWETLNSFETVDSYPTDDKFVQLGPSNSYALAIGRLPVRNLNDATTAIDKIISYESSSPLDPWRNTITLVSDDGKTSQGDDGNTYTNHSEALAGMNSLTSYDINKIYEIAYPTVNSAGGRRKPDVNKVIIGAINSGTVFTNYIGHGNDRVWAHESVFTREDDLPQLSNKEKLTFVATATCSFGWYDNPSEISSAEELITMDHGGAIATYTAARVVYDDQNFSLDQALIIYLFQRNADGQYPRIGDASLLAKSSTVSDNSFKYHLFGDPTVRLLLPRNDATVDSINEMSITNDTVRLKSLGNAHIAGAVRKNNVKLTSFSGVGTLQLFDSQKDISIVEGTAYNNLFQFKLKGSLLYRGDVSVTNGQYNALIPIPKDVTIGKNARISMYAWSGQSDGTGSTENVIIDGMDTTIARDTVGPVLAVYLDTIAFRPGDVVKSDPVIIVQLEDESGINTSTVGVGHQLSATLSNPDRTFDLSGYYHSSLDNYKKGEVRYPLSNLNDGKYTLSVKAWDIQNNSSKAETYFEVHAADDFAMLNVVNYPNPFAHATTFTFQRTSTDPIDVEIKIYSVAGRLIGDILVPHIADTFVRIPWDGKDTDGNSLANGIYFYKVIARDNNGQRSNETIGKMAVMH